MISVINERADKIVPIGLALIVQVSISVSTLNPLRLCLCLALIFYELYLDYTGLKVVLRTIVSVAVNISIY